MQQTRPIRAILCGWLALFFLAAGQAPPCSAGSLLYKNYIIRYDRGWDILCEPYVVRQGDWVLKIFRQKGEIAHQDFRDFLGIFERLNPHVRDINLVQPGQAIDIPLRKLEHGAFSGQASGVVTIPFVNLTQVKEVIKEHSEAYQVRPGDTISRLMARKYGNYGSASYEEGLKLFKAANPDITDLNRINVGQRIYLPDPEIREKSFYAAMYDESGNLRENLPQSQTPAKGAAQPQAASASMALPTPAPAVQAPVQPYASTVISAPSTPAAASPPPIPPKPTPRIALPVAPPSPPAPDTGKPEPSNALKTAASIVGGELRAKGTYYQPRADQQDFEIDLSQHPMLRLPDGGKVIFSPDERIMTMARQAFEAQWPEMKTVDLAPDATSEQIVASIFKALEENGKTENEVTFETQGVHVSVRARWTRTRPDGGHLCITPIAKPDERTPEPIRRFLEQNGVLLQEMLPGGNPAVIPDDSQRHRVRNLLALTDSNPKDFMQSLAKALGLTYVANTGITFPYAGIQVQAYADLVSAGQGQETLLDFGDLYGDAITAIRQTGLNIVQFSAGESDMAMAEKLLTALSLSFEIQPTFQAAPRPPLHNTSITVAGILCAASQDRRVLLTGHALPAAVSDLISAQGIDMVMW